MTELTPDVLAVLEAVQSDRPKPGQRCKTCSLPHPIAVALDVGRFDRDFSFAACAELLRRLKHPVVESALRSHFTKGHARPAR